MTGIEERIAKVMIKHGGWYANSDQTASACDCDWEGDSGAAHVAAVLVAELGLMREDRWVPVDESGERWWPRSMTGAQAAALRYPPGHPDGGITHIEYERRHVTAWETPE